MFKFKIQKALALVMAVLLVVGAAPIIPIHKVFAADVAYYVDSIDGNDSNDGKSPSTAWKTLDQVNSVTFLPGETILFKTDCTWSGTLSLKGSGSSTAPIKIDMYGTGNKPHIAGTGTGDAIYIFNNEYIEISNLEITNDDLVGKAIAKGVHILAQDIGTRNHIYLKNLDIHDCAGDLTWRPKSAGIFVEITGSTTKTNFDDLRIEGCKIYNMKNCPGIQTMSTWSNYKDANNWCPSTNVVIQNNAIYNDTQYTMEANTIRAVQGALFQNNVIYGVTASGCYYFESLDSIMQFNESYAVRSSGGDGTGLDIDYSQNGTIVQYNYVHDNAWEGFTVFSAGANSNIGSIIRYNISQNDKKRFVRMSGPTQNAQIYNNVSYGYSGAQEIIIQNSWGGYPLDTKFKNNILYNNSPTAAYVFNDSKNNVFESNCFYGFHPASEPADHYKITLDPMLVNPGSGTIGRDTVDGYKLKAGSLCIGNGVLISNNGGRDYWGNPVSSTEKPNIGPYNGQGISSSDLVDKSGLASGIAQAQALNQGDYSADSWSALQMNLQAAIAVNESMTATQNDVFTAMKNLNTALNNLVVSVKGVQLNKTSIVLEVGGADTLIARVTPDKAVNKKITFTKAGNAISVSDAVYNSDGSMSVSITALAVGTATITATAEDGGWTATYTVEVVEATTNNNNLAINGGFESGVKTPWTTYQTAGVSNTNVYTGTYCGYVGPSGSLDQLLTGLTPNTTYSYSAWVCVEKSGESVQIGVKNYGRTQVLQTATSTSYQKYTVIFTTGATNTKANIWFWKSGAWGTGKAYIDSAVVTPIDKNGLASGIAQAQALNQDDYTGDSWSAFQMDLQAAIAVNESITANQNEVDNALKNLTIAINSLVIKVKGLQLNKTSNTLTVGGTDTLIAMVIPNNATNKEVVFTKDGNAVSVSDAVYNADGTTSVTITAIEVGTATITATEVGSGLTAQYKVTVANTIPTTLTGPDSVGVGEQITLKYGLVGVQNISAQDITVSYDKNLFDFVIAESVINGTVIQETYNNAEAGTVRFILVSTGAENAISGTVDIMNIKFNTKTSGTGNISVTNASLSNGQGEMTYAATSNKSITVDTDKAALIAAINAAQVIYNNAEEGLAIGQYPAETKARLNIAIVNAAAVRDNMATTAQVVQAIADLNTALNTFKSLVIISSTGDINVDGKIDVGDLGIVAYNYEKKAGAPDWDAIKNADINGDGEIGLYDLAFIAKKILGN